MRGQTGQTNSASSRSRYPGPGRLGLGLCVAVLMWSTTGCQTVCTDTSMAPRHPCRPVGTAERPLATSRGHKTDYAHPSAFTTQFFSWNRHGCEWTIIIPVVPQACAGVVFRKTYDLSERRANKWLTFQLKPAHLAEHLTLVMTDHPKGQTGITLANPLANYQVGVRGDWGFYSIRFDEFDEQVRTVGLQEQTACEPMNWSRIKGMRIARLTDQGPPMELTLRHVKFQSEGVSIPQQYANAR